MLTDLLLLELLDAPAVSPPAPIVSGEPLSLDDVRLNLRQPPEQQNARLIDLIVAAREYVEEETGLVLTRRTVTETASSLGRSIELSSWPVISIDAIAVPTGPAMTTLASTAWLASLNRRPVRIVPVVPGWGLPGWGVPGDYGIPRRATLPVEIDLTAGFATPADVPMRAKQAMHMLIAHWFANREGAEVGLRAAAVEVPLGVTELLRGLRLARI